MSFVRSSVMAGAGLLAICCPSLSAAPAGSTAVKTNFFERWVTNAIEVRIPVNRMVNGDNGAFLCFGQDQEFGRALPPGKYKVQVKTRSADSNAPLTFKATLLVSPNEIRIEQGTLAKR